MNISFLETFYWLATLKNVSETARRLGINQPVVSMRMAALQKSLGTELYKGSGRNLELTHAGRRVLAKCEAIMLLSKELDDEVRQAATATTIAYVGVAEVIGLAWLPELLETMRDDHPGLSVALRTGLLSDVIQSVIDGQTDVALVVGSINDPNIVSDPICEFDVKWVASPGHLPAKPKMDILDLARLPIIRPLRASYRFEKMLEYFRWHNVEDTDAFQPRHWVDVGFGMMTCAHLASRGVGVTAVPAVVASDLIREGRLAILNVQQEFFPWQIAAIRRRGANSQIVEPIIESARKAATQYEALSDNHRYFRTTF